MVQYSQPLDTTFAALSDATRRGILERLGRGQRLDQRPRRRLRDDPDRDQEARADPGGRRSWCTTEKVGRVRTCRLGPRRLEDEQAWIAQVPADARGPVRPARRVPPQIHDRRKDRPMSAAVKDATRKATVTTPERPRDPDRAHVRRAPRAGVAGIHRPEAGGAVVGPGQQARSSSEWKWRRAATGASSSTAPRACTASRAATARSRRRPGWSRRSSGTGCRPTSSSRR